MDELEGCVDNQHCSACDTTFASALGIHFIIVSAVFAVVGLAVLLRAACRLLQIKRTHRSRVYWLHRLDARIHFIVIYIALSLMFTAFDVDGYRNATPPWLEQQLQDTGLAAAASGLLWVLRRWLVILFASGARRDGGKHCMVRTTAWGVAIITAIVAISSVAFGVCEYVIVPPDVAALGGRNRLFIGLKYAVLGGTFCIMFFMTVAWGTRIFCRVERTFSGDDFKARRGSSFATRGVVRGNSFRGNGSFRTEASTTGDNYGRVRGSSSASASAGPTATGTASPTPSAPRRGDSGDSVGSKPPRRLSLAERVLMARGSPGLSVETGRGGSNRSNSSVTSPTSTGSTGSKQQTAAEMLQQMAGQGGTPGSPHTSAPPSPAATTASKRRKRRRSTRGSIVQATLPWSPRGTRVLCSLVTFALMSLVLFAACVFHAMEELVLGECRFVRPTLPAEPWLLYFQPAPVSLVFTAIVLLVQFPRTMQQKSVARMNRLRRAASSHRSNVKLSMRPIAMGKKGSSKRGRAGSDLQQATQNPVSELDIDLDV